MYDSSKLIFGNMDMVVNFRRFTCENRTIMDEKQSKSIESWAVPIENETRVFLTEVCSEFQYLLLIFIILPAH